MSSPETLRDREQIAGSGAGIIFAVTGQFSTGFTSHVQYRRTFAPKRFVQLSITSTTPFQISAAICSVEHTGGCRC